MPRVQHPLAPALRLAPAVLLAASAGCVSPSQPPAAPTGGARIELSYAEYVANVAPVVTRHGCDADGDCHGGGPRGTLQLSPPTAKDAHYDFEQLTLQVNPVQRDSSALLLRPLADAAGGRPHPMKAFASTADTDFVAVRGWILAGVTR